MPLGNTWKGPPMSAETAEALYKALEEKYPGKVRRVVECCPVAVMKTFDNDFDAQETLRRCAQVPGPAKG